MRVIVIALLAVVVVGCAITQATTDTDRRHHGHGSSTTVKCGGSDVVLPSINQNGYLELSPPGGNLKVVRIAIGKGYQLYTCQSSSKNDVPVANGAKAQLYDVSCLALKHAKLLHSLPGFLLNASPSVENFVVSQIREISKTDIRLGQHYFATPTTPVFNFTKHGRGQVFFGKKLENVKAPATSAQGKYGAVDWLKLGAVAGTKGFQLVYRVVTAGGKPPQNCEGLLKSFSIPYAAEYWFYN